MSIRRLAKHLGLSVTTVSRALAGYSDVAAATRERVQQEADRTGYRPNPVAQRLRVGRRGTVGLVVPAEQGTFDQFFLAMLGAVGPLLSRAGLDLVMMGAPPGEAELHAYRQLVELHRVDGILLARTRRDDARIRYLLDRGVPFVAHGRSETAGVFAYLDLDGEAAFAEATERLVGFGHRDIALINAPEHYMFASASGGGLAACVGCRWVAGRAGAAGGGDRGERHRLMSMLLARCGDGLRRCCVRRIGWRWGRCMRSPRRGCARGAMFRSSATTTCRWRAILIRR